MRDNPFVPLSFLSPCHFFMPAHTVHVLPVVVEVIKPFVTVYCDGWFHLWRVIAINGAEPQPQQPDQGHTYNKPTEITAGSSPDVIRVGKIVKRIGDVFAARQANEFLMILHLERVVYFGSAVRAVHPVDTGVGKQRFNGVFPVRFVGMLFHRYSYIKQSIRLLPRRSPSPV
mgnify:CR=1 FL=1